MLKQGFHAANCPNFRRHLFVAGPALCLLGIVRLNEGAQKPRILRHPCNNASGKAIAIAAKGRPKKNRQN
jgi:hypothetical protein